MRDASLKRRVDYEIARFAMMIHIPEKDRNKIIFPWEKNESKWTKEKIEEYKKSKFYNRK